MALGSNFPRSARTLSPLYVAPGTRGAGLYCGMTKNPLWDRQGLSLPWY